MRNLFMLAICSDVHGISLRCWWQSCSRQQISVSSPRQIESFLAAGGESLNFCWVVVKRHRDSERRLLPLRARTKSNDNNFYVSSLCSREKKAKNKKWNQQKKCKHEDKKVDLHRNVEEASEEKLVVNGHWYETTLVEFGWCFSHHNAQPNAPSKK